MRHLTLVYSATPAAVRLTEPPPPRCDATEQRLTGHDLIALTCWTQRSDSHGYRRVLIEGGSGAGEPEDGGYALIYAPGQDWASWGVARTAAGVTVWHCGSGSDIGRHATMLAALDSLPPASGRPGSRSRAAAPAAGLRCPEMRLA